jgi:hypothetical protein
MLKPVGKGGEGLFMVSSKNTNLKDVRSPVRVAGAKGLVLSVPVKLFARESPHAGI